jgi:hypothetical protein
MFKLLKLTSRRFYNAVYRLSGSWKLLRLLIIPYALGLLSFVLFILLLFSNFKAVEAGLWGITMRNSWVAEMLTYFMIPVIAIFGAVMVVFGGFQFILEKMLTLVLHERGLVIVERKDLLRSTWRTIGEVLVSILLLGAMLTIMLFTIIIPGVNLIVAALTALYMGTDILRMCLSALRMKLGSQWNVICRYFLEISGIGFITGIIASIPLIGIFLLPVAFLACAEAIADWIEDGDIDLSECIVSHKTG